MSQKTCSPDDTLQSIKMNEDIHDSTYGILCPVLESFWSYAIRKPNFFFGRKSTCDYSIEEKMFTDSRAFFYISNLHFEISKTPNMSPNITDHSRAGTFLNGKKIGQGNSEPLNHDDIISIGTDNIKVFIYKSTETIRDYFLSENLRKIYEVSRRLGVGGFGEVRMVIHKSTNRPYAVKKIKKSNSSTTIERDILQELKHPHIISFISSEETTDDFFIVMEYMDKGDLKDVMKDFKLTEEQAKYIFLQITKGVEYLHKRKIIHRDLKPSNILAKRNREDFLFKVTDFGISKILDDESLASTMCGTEHYMAPEFYSKELHNYKVDVWSMGVILFEMIFSQLPFRKGIYPEITSCISEKLERKMATYMDVSYDVKYLIKDMLILSPRKRLGVQDIFRYDWIGQDNEILDKIQRIFEENENRSTSSF